MNAHERKLVESLRQRIDNLETLLDTGPRVRCTAAPVNPALLWRDRVIGLIKIAVAAEFGGTPEELSHKCRKRYVVMKRHIAMHLCRRAGMSLNEVGEAFDCKNHTSVIYAVEHVKVMRVAASVDRAVERLEAAIDQRLAEAMAA